MLAMVFLCCTFSSCPPKVYTPPSRLWIYDTPAPLEKGRQTAGIHGGAHTDISVGPFSSGSQLVGSSGEIFYRRGLTDNLEIRADGGLLGLGPVGKSADVSPLVGSLHLQTKYSPLAFHRFASLRLGTGAGFSEAATYCSFDGGINLGWETKCVTPFISPGVFISLPLRARIVNFNQSAASDSAEFFADRAEITYGFHGGYGLKIHLQSGKQLAAPSLLLLGDFTVLDTRYHDGPQMIFSFGGGMEFAF